VKLAHLYIFWIHGESLDLQILANNLQNNGIDLKGIEVLRWANFIKRTYMSGKSKTLVVENRF